MKLETESKHTNQATKLRAICGGKSKLHARLKCETRLAFETRCCCVLAAAATRWRAAEKRKRALSFWRGSLQYYHFTAFAMRLNEPTADGERPCATDSRLRPDIRLMEAGDVEAAAAEKARLEQKQRDARRARKSRKEKEAKPR